MDNELIHGVPTQQFNGEDCIIIPIRLIRNVTYDMPCRDVIPTLTIEVIADWRLRLNIHSFIKSHKMGLQL